MTAAVTSGPGSENAGITRRAKQQFATMGERRRFWGKLFVDHRLVSRWPTDQKAITKPPNS
ncbi:hypothetical protein ACNKHM_15105 [Shigella sonnei]